MAGGLALAPGFIDSHTHDDQAVLATPLLECKLSRGVTKVIAGNCGISLAQLRAACPLPPRCRVCPPICSPGWPAVIPLADPGPCNDR